MYVVFPRALPKLHVLFVIHGGTNGSIISTASIVRCVHFNYRFKSCINSTKKQLALMT